MEKEPTKLAARVYTQGSPRVLNSEVTVSFKEGVLSLQSNEGLIMLDSAAINTMKAVLDEVNLIDRPAGLIPAQNGSTKDLPVDGLPPETFSAEKKTALAAEPWGKDGTEAKAWFDFRESGLPLLVNQVLHAFGYALTFFEDEGEGLDCIPMKVPFRGFKEEDQDIAYKKIGEYMKANSDALLEAVKS